MVCPECNGTGETVYFVELDRDENSVTLKERKGICLTCKGNGAKTMTNADRIRSMSDEKLAKFIDENLEECPFKTIVTCIGCQKCILNWLQHTVEDE